MGSLFNNSLAWWQWAVFAAVPPLIVLLYFLKLRRRPLEVPSTFLWHKAVEDLHVNSIWQRLRQNILLFLQLLLMAILALALLRPGLQGMQLQRDKVILLIDASASMSATDVGPSRLDEAKRQAAAVIDLMQGDVKGMIVSFSDVAKIEQVFTDNRHTLKARLQAIEPTNRTSNLEDALRAAAGLANPNRTGVAGEDDVVAQGFPAEMFIFSDGGFKSVPKFSLGNLQPKYMKIGRDSENVAVTTFSVDRNPEKPDRLQAFARLENFGAKPAILDASLYLNGELLDAQQASIPARDVEPGASGLQFELADAAEGTLRLELSTKDSLLIDDKAYAVVNPPRPARVLVVSPGERTALWLALETEEAKKISQVTFAAPSHLDSKQYETDAEAGVFDLIVYDRCQPKKPPQCNTLFIGRAPPFPGWESGDKQASPIIADIDRLHPLAQLLDMSSVLITETVSLKTPPGGTALMTADQQTGTVYAVAPRLSFEDAALGFEIVTTKADGTDAPATNWHLRRSFPVFVMNAVKYLGGNHGQAALTSVQPGDAFPIRTVLPVPSVQVETPSGKKLEVTREGLSSIAFTQTDELGVYSVREGSGTQASQQFTVNLFDPRESDLTPAETVPIGYEEVAAVAGKGGELTRKEWWKTLLLIALGVLLFEWYVFNRRVYL